MRSERLPGIDALRAVAAGMVLIYHVDQLHLGRLPGPLGLVSAGGQVGVTLFFVISGYVLYRPMADRPPDLRMYLVRRFLRIYPAYVVALIGTSLLLGVAFDVRYLLFLQQVQLDDPSELMRIGWTLQVEVAFYLALPIAAAGLRRVRSPFRLPALLATVLPLYLLSVSHGWSTTMGPETVFTSAWAFPLGMAAALYRPTRRGPLAIGGGALLVFGLAYPLPPPLNLPVGFAAAMLVLAATLWTPPRVLTLAGTRLSYAVYLWHWPILAATGNLAVALAGIAGVALASWTFVERPALRIVSRRGEAAGAAGTESTAKGSLLRGSAVLPGP